MKIYLTSCETGPNAWRHQEDRLRKLWELSSRRHSFVDDPADAEVILVGNLRYEKTLSSLRNHTIVRRFPNKCFVIDETDDPRPFVLRGLYTSGYVGLAHPARFRTHSYGLTHPDFKNPYVEAYEGLAAEKPKSYLFSFAGRNCVPLRDAIFRQTFSRPDILIQDTSAFNLFTHVQAGKTERQRLFTEELERSKFVVCPRGNGAASIRLFEVMKLGIAPVILADDWVLPSGPRWSEFALFIKEKDVSTIESVIAQHEGRYREMGRLAAEEYQRCFSDSALFDSIVASVEEMIGQNRIPESFYWRARGLIALGWKIKRRFKRS